jgi:hypothetical protein
MSPLHPLLAVGDEVAHLLVLAEEQTHGRVGLVPAGLLIPRQHETLLVLHVPQQSFPVTGKNRRSVDEVAIEQRPLVREESAARGRRAAPSSAA